MSEAMRTADPDTFPKLLARNVARVGRTAPPTARRNTASGRPGPGPRPRPRSWRWPPASPRWVSAAATTSRSSAATARALLGDGGGAGLRRECRCRSTRTRSAEEIAFVLEHCGARFVVAGDQEQVDKVLEVAGALPRARARSSTSTRAACATTTTPACTAYADVQATGRSAGAGGPRAALGRRGSPGRARTTPASCSTPPAPPAGPRASCCRNRNIIATARATPSSTG